MDGEIPWSQGCTRDYLLSEVSLLPQFTQGSWECEVFIHHTAMKIFTNLFEMKINSGMSYLF